MVLHDTRHPARIAPDCGSQLAFRSALNIKHAFGAFMPGATGPCRAVCETKPSGLFVTQSMRKLHDLNKCAKGCSRQPCQPLFEFYYKTGYIRTCLIANVNSKGDQPLFSVSGSICSPNAISGLCRKIYESSKVHIVIDHVSLTVRASALASRPRERQNAVHFCTFKHAFKCIPRCVLILKTV